MPLQRLIAPALTAALIGVAVLALALTRGGGGSDPTSLAISSITATSTASPTHTPTASPTPTPPPTPTSTPLPPPPPRPQVQQAPAQPPQPAARTYSEAGFASQVVALVNAERASRGLGQLSSNGALSNSASSYARQLLQYSSLSHSAGGTTLSGRVAAAGYGGGPPLGEVLWLGVGRLPPERVVSDWMNSPSHREVILNPTYDRAGVGCYFREGQRLESRCAMDLAG
ncbi:MAG: CAP domain-containing protein [Dehalococcoidia bacterium]